LARTGFEAISLNLTDDMPAAREATSMADRKRHRNATRLEKYFGYPTHGQRKHSGPMPRRSLTVDRILLAGKQAFGPDLEYS
jgi:hypothetical protein